MTTPAIRNGVSYDDVLLVPQRSPVDSRDEIDLSTSLAPTLQLDVPITSAAMDTVTEATLATELSRLGGLGVIHRFLTIEGQAEEIAAVKRENERVAAALGMDEETHERATALVDAGVDALVVDVAHGHMDRCLDAVSDLDGSFDLPIVAGNVATAAGTRDLAAAGADCVKVGVGPGSHCTTREVAGAGVPQLTAVMDAAEAAAEEDVSVIADGGIRNSGEIAKALVAGADAVMLGGLLSGTTEAPGETVDRDGTTYKVSRGMASKEAANGRQDKDLEIGASEGVAGLTPYRGDLEGVVEQLAAGVRSGLSYCGGFTIEEARDGATFVECSDGAKSRSGAHAGVVRRGD